MTEVKVGLLENFAIKNWYRFLLYIGGVILVLSLFLETKGIEASKVRLFSIWTVLLGLVLWIIEDILKQIGSYLEYQYEEHKIYESELEDYGKILVGIWYLISIGVFIFWILYILPALY